MTVAADTGAAVVWEVSLADPSPDAVLSELAVFGDEIALCDAIVAPYQVRPGAHVIITLRWRALRRPSADYTVFVHLLSADDQRVAQHDGRPLGGNWPTTLWSPGEELVDQHTLRVPEHLGPMRSRLRVGLYQYPTGQRLPARSVALPVSDDAVLVEPRVVVK